MDPNRGIGWNSVGGDVQTSGEVRFEETAPERTRIDVTMNYSDPPGGKVGEVAANVLSSPGREMREDIENFARKAERAEIEWSGPGARAR